MISLMPMSSRAVLLAAMLLAAVPLRAADVGSVRGVVHDQQHRPLPEVQVKLKSATSEWVESSTTDAHGEFSYMTVPLGDYVLSFSAADFAPAAQAVTVTSGSSPVAHVQLVKGPALDTLTVTAAADTTVLTTATPTTVVNRLDIERAPGADRSNSLAMITDFVPGAYVVHDQLHVRGGHQTTWAIDGVEIPNTNIASNLGPQIDPKDIDYLEVQRGSYDASLGDRTYGEFNVVPRSGFERNNEAELVTTFGNWFQTNDQLNFGGHTEKFAYYASINGNRSNLGLQTPAGQVVHDAENGFGGFGTLLYNVDAKNQLRLVWQARQDYYQIPYDPNPNSFLNSQFNSSGLRDAQHENDAFVAFSWVRTLNSNMLLTVSPFFHHNTANYGSDPNDTPQAAIDNRTSDYAGGQVTYSVTYARNNIQAGLYGFKQYDTEFFNLI